MNTHQHRIFLVDDHPLVREWLANFLQRQANFTICGEADSVGAALDGIVDTKPDVAIVDLSLARGWGLDLIKQVMIHAPDTRVIVLSMHDEKLYAERVMRSGAIGYVMKRETPKVIVAAIRQVLKGEPYLSANMQAVIADKLVGGGRSEQTSPIEKLSDRELEVFRLLGRGMPARQVALSMSLSVKTVQSYCARMREKLCLANAAELAREAVRYCESEARG